jgi:hypothetical protein
MNSRIVIAAAVAIFVIGLLLVALSRHKAAAELHAALEKAQSELAVVAAKLQQLEVQVRSTDHAAPSFSLPRQDSNEDGAKRSENPQSLEQRKQAQTRDAVIDQAATQSPELQDLYVKQQTIRFPQKFGLLYASLGLSPAQIAEFERIMGDDAQALYDMSISALSQGIAKDDSAVRKLVMEAREMRNQQLRALLGDSGFKDFAAYERNTSAKTLTDTLAQTLYYTDSPFTRDTAIEFNRLVVSNAVKNGGSLNWSELVTEARRFMTPTQIRALEMQQEIVATGAKVHDALQKAGVDMKNPSP